MPGAPERLSPEFELSGFYSGESALDEWLRRNAALNELSGASRTYVVCEAKRVIAYYSLAVGAVGREASSSRMRRNMPEPIPVMLLRRLAVDREFQGMGLGTSLLRDAVLRTVQAAAIAGIRGMLVHAINQRAQQFYLERGFMPSPVDPLTLMITIDEARRIIDACY